MQKGDDSIHGKAIANPILSECIQGWEKHNFESAVHAKMDGAYQHVRKTESLYREKDRMIKAIFSGIIGTKIACSVSKEMEK